MKKVILLSAALLLVGCASLEKTSTELNSKWIGKSYDEFAMEYGVAKSNQKLNNGMTVYMWEQVDPENANGARCTLKILADSSNNIASIKASGDPDFCP